MHKRKGCCNLLAQFMQNVCVCIQMKALIIHVEGIHACIHELMCRFEPEEMNQGM